MLSLTDKRTPPEKEIFSILWGDGEWKVYLKINYGLVPLNIWPPTENPGSASDLLAWK